MRIATLATLIIATLAVAGPVRAQTYNPHYPVCMQVYSPFVYLTVTSTRSRNARRPPPDAARNA